MDPKASESINRAHLGGRDKDWREWAASRIVNCVVCPPEKKEAVAESAPVRPQLVQKGGVAQERVQRC